MLMTVLNSKLKMTGKSCCFSDIVAVSHYHSDPSVTTLSVVILSSFNVMNYIMTNSNANFHSL